jgi:co-chaperonin GroES (HSP10)
MKFRPLHDRVVIERIDAEAKTAGGIIIPDTAQEKPQQGKVIAVGQRNVYLNVRISQENRMHRKKRQKQIQYLQAKHGNDRSLAREFPDLKVEQRTAPCSNGMRGRTVRRVLPPGMKQFPVGHCHKQGYELIKPGTDLQWMGGKKP